IEERGDGEVERGLPARDGNGPDAALERADALFEDRAGRIGDPRIDVTCALHVEKRRGVIAVGKNKRRALIDGRRACAGGGIRRRTRMEAQRIEMRAFWFGHGDARRRIPESRLW